jgi:4-amino-4-deoxy-L-arabinose transferase-like glycosyltransferase
MYLLGRRLFGRGTGLLAALLLAMSTCAVVYSQEARGYSWLLFGTIVSTYFFVRLVVRPTYSMALAYALAAGVTFYFHYFGLLVPVAQLVSLIALPKDRRPLKQLYLAAAVLAVFAAPVLWLIHIQPGRHLDWVSKPSLLELYHLGVFLAAESGKGVGPVLLVFDLVLIGVFVQTMLATKRASSDSGTGPWPYAMVASCLLTPIVISLLVSVVRPVFFHRFLIICLPAWIIAVAVGANAISKLRWKASAIIAVCALSLVSTGLSYSRMREDWRGAVNFLIDNARSRDVVLYYRGVGHFAAENYRDWLPGGAANRPLGIEVGAPGVDWRARLQSAHRVWLVEYPANVSDDTSRAVEAELHSHFTAVGSRPFRAISVTEFIAKSN